MYSISCVTGPHLVPKQFPKIYYSQSLANLLQTFKSKMPTLRPNTKLLAFVMSSPTHFFRRSFIRSTWGSKRFQELLNMQVIFMIGQHPSTEVWQLQLKSEMYTNQDMLLGHYRDSYR